MDGVLNDAPPRRAAPSFASSRLRWNVRMYFTRDSSSSVVECSAIPLCRQTSSSLTRLREHGESDHHGVERARHTSRFEKLDQPTRHARGCGRVAGKETHISPACSFVRRLACIPSGSRKETRDRSLVSSTHDIPDSTYSSVPSSLSLHRDRILWDASASVGGCMIQCVRRGSTQKPGCVCNHRRN